MTLTVTSKRLPDEMPGGQDEKGCRTYTETYEVTQTDGGALAAPVAIAIAGQSVMTGDPVPLRGGNYSYGGTTDPDSYAHSFAWRLPYPKDNPKIVHVTVNFG